MKDNRRKIGIGIAVCACVLLIGAGLYLTRNNKQETQESPDSAFVPDLDPDASTQEAKESDPPEGIRIPGYPSITIPADTKDVTVNLMNPEGNPCYFAFTLVLKDDLSVQNGRTGKSDHADHTVQRTVRRGISCDTEDQYCGNG